MLAASAPGAPPSLVTLSAKWATPGNTQIDGPTDPINNFIRWIIIVMGHGIEST